jgi:hypothetical protein
VLITLAQWQEVQQCRRGRWIVSLDRAKLSHHSAQALAREYDLLIVDEAHKLKNRTTLAWQFVNQVRKRYVLMLTATPVQNDLMELYSLITILTPGQLGTVRAFRRHFVEQSDPRHPKNPASLRRLLNDVMIRNRRSKVDIQFPKRQAAIYHLELSEAEWALYREVTEYIRRRFRDGDSNKHLRLTLVTLQKELSSSPQALAAHAAQDGGGRAHGDGVRAELQRFLALAEAIPLSRKLRPCASSHPYPRPVPDLHRIPRDAGHARTAVARLGRQHGWLSRRSGHRAEGAAVTAFRSRRRRARHGEHRKRGRRGVTCSSATS